MTDTNSIAIEMQKLIAERDTAARMYSELLRDFMAQLRELERLRHGDTIESDFICPDSLAFTNAEATIRKLFEVVQAYRAEWGHYGPDYGSGVLDIVLQRMDAVIHPGPAIRCEDCILTTHIEPSIRFRADGKFRCNDCAAHGRKS